MGETTADQNGRMGIWAGLGQAIIGGKLTNSPLNAGLFSVQMVFMAAIRSAIRRKRLLNSVP